MNKYYIKYVTGKLANTYMTITTNNEYEVDSYYIDKRRKCSFLVISKD